MTAPTTVSTLSGNGISRRRPMRTLTGLAALVLAAGGDPASAREARSTAPLKPRTATFDVRHELNVLVPEGTRKLRVWFTMPQDDPAQKVEGFKVDCPFPTRIEKDSEGNQSVYVEVSDPKRKEFSVV